jgi:aspartate/methionine/tyrosine aminotransferase
MNVTHAALRVRPCQPDRIRRLQLPELLPIAGTSARQADLQLLSQAPRGFLDTTHFDTVRFPAPPWALEAFCKAAKDGAMAYTGYRGHPDVLEAVSKSVGTLLGVAVDSRLHLALTPGTQAGLFTSLSSLIDDGDRVALVDPDYLFSARILRYLGAEIAHVPLVSGIGSLAPDIGRLETEFKDRGTRVLVFSHPNNPTGAVYPKDVMAQIATLAVRHDVTVVVDELYARLLHDDCPFPHLAAEPGMFERTITLLGPSKTESLSGYRLGVVVGPSGHIERIENVLSITSLRAPAYAQHVLIPWLRDDRDWLAQRLKEFSALRAMTIKKLRRLSWLRLTPQAGTAYAWPDVSALRISAPAVAKALLVEAGVLVSPGYQFGPRSGGCFRVCYARDETEWSAALDGMVSVLDRLAGESGLLRERS